MYEIAWCDPIEGNSTCDAIPYRSAHLRKGTDWFIISLPESAWKGKIPFK